MSTDSSTPNRTPHDGARRSPACPTSGYIKLAIALAVITAIEVAISYMVDDLGAFFLPLLIVLMLIKFFSVVLFFMHLKFDNRLFSLMFYLGLGLAVAVYVVALFTFQFFSP